MTTKSSIRGIKKVKNDGINRYNQNKSERCYKSAKDKKESPQKRDYPL